MIGSGTLTKEIAGYLARTGFDALDDDALRATKEHILYTLGTILAGSSAPGIKQALGGARALSGVSQESTVLVTGDKLPAAFAALVNATMGHSRELDINDDRIAYKSSITVIPAALAVDRLLPFHGFRQQHGCSILVEKIGRRFRGAERCDCCVACVGR